MIYIILAGAFMVTAGIVLANYEMVKQRRDRSERLRHRARRCVRRDMYGFSETPMYPANATAH